MIKNVFIIVAMIAVTCAFATLLGCTGDRQGSNSGSPVATSSDQPLDLPEVRDYTNLNVYRDDKFPFTIAYSKEWNTVAATNPDVRLSLVNRKPDGALNAGFNITADFSPELKDRTVAQQKDAINAYLNGTLDTLKAASPHIKVVQRGETQLSGQAAYYILIEGQVDQADKTKAIRVLQMRTFRAGNGYDLTFSCEADTYDSVLPAFKLIAGGFKITSSP